jgi:hypothetical protein
MALDGGARVVRQRNGALTLATPYTPQKLVQGCRAPASDWLTPVGATRPQIERLQSSLQQSFVLKPGAQPISWPGEALSFYHVPCIVLGSHVLGSCMHAAGVIRSEERLGCSSPLSSPLFGAWWPVPKAAREARSYSLWADTTILVMNVLSGCAQSPHSPSLALSPGAACCN